MTEPGEPIGPEAKPPRDRRQLWIIVGSGIAAVAVMLGVVVLAKASGANHSPEGGASSEVAASPAPDRTHPVGPPAVEPLPEGCDVDYDHPPKMVIDLPPEGVDFGAIKQGVKAERDIVIRNTGDGPLCLRKPTVGCGCVKAMLVEDQRKIAPGASATIKISFDSTGREGVTTKTVTINSTDPVTPTKTVQVRAEVSLGLVVSAMRVDFGNAALGKPATATIRLRSPKSDAPWTVSSVESVPMQGRPEPPPLTFEAKDTEDPTWRIVDVTIHHPGQVAYGTFGGQVRIRTTHPDRAEITLPSWIQVVPSVQAFPPNASLGFGEKARVRLVPNAEDVRFKVTGARVQTLDGTDPGALGPGFTVEYGETTEGPHRAGEWWVEIRYDGKSRQAGPLRAEAVITTDAPDAPEIKITISKQVPK